MYFEMEEVLNMEIFLIKGIKDFLNRMESDIFEFEGSLGSLFAGRRVLSFFFYFFIFFLNLMNN